MFYKADEATWGLPDWALHTSVWYRKDLFEEKGLEIPTNWDEFKTVAEALDIDENNDGNYGHLRFCCAYESCPGSPSDLL